MILPPAVLDRLTGLRFFNAGVFGGLPEDHLAVYRLLFEQGARPTVLFLGLEDVSLNDFQPVSDETSSYYELARQIYPAVNGPLGRFRHVAKLYHESISTDVVVDMGRSIAQRISPSEPINFFLPDGRLSYPKADRQIQSRTYDVDAEIQHTFSYISTLRRMALSSLRMQYLETLISEARQRNTKVRLFVTPYHPRLLAAIQKDAIAWQHHSMALEYYHSLEARFGIRVTDYTDENTFGGSPAAWYDGVHYNIDNAVKLIRQGVQDGI